MKINQNTRDMVMRGLGHQEKHLGTQYIRTALDLYQPGMGVTKELYPGIARAHNTTPSRVERAIRHSIQSAWTHSSGEVAQNIFFDSIDAAWPTNAEYIAVMARLCHEAESA